MKQNPRNARIFLSLGILYEAELRQYKKALFCYNKYLAYSRNKICNIKWLRDGWMR